jgi:hypothetical protein
MEGGVASHVVDVRVDTGGAASVTRFISRQSVLAAFVAVIALAFHVTGSTGPGSSAQQAVLPLAVLIGQINMPRRQLCRLLRGTSTTPHAIGADPLTQR